jgi:hypothetical protein
MKLHATITSERGKPVSKSGNDRLEISVVNENRKQVALITILPSGSVILDECKEGEIIIMK